MAMFSISAINDTDSKGQWEPLAPTKEAQEFHLSQTYHEGLIQLQAKEFTKARELLESVLKDPLISNAQVDSNASDGHLLQLRFLALKNLSSVFLQQGSMHYESALSCYLQAVEIDAKDSVVWNQLGTLACTMGLFSMSRWAFEQGLFCSPNNWNCMEKLLEVLIAIGDEVACLSVADLILRHWPSHSRALHVKSTIQESDPIPFAPRGIDKLEPKHVRLKFPEKRKRADESLDENVGLKRHKQIIDLYLPEVSWAAVVDATLNILSRRGSEHGAGCNQDDNEKLGCRRAKVMARNTATHVNGAGITSSETGDGSEKLDRRGNIRITIHLPSEYVMDSAEGEGVSPISAGENMSYSDCVSEKANVVKEKEACVDEEHPQERRSTRLERLRSRKPGKEELDFASSKDLAKVVIQSLEPFIADRSAIKDSNCSGSFSVPGPDAVSSSTHPEYNAVVSFITDASNNYGAYHVAHLLLEEVARINVPYQENFMKLLELEKLTRHWGQDRTPECSLFLAELNYDFGSCSANESKSSFFSESSYHLCKVIEMVALDLPAHLIGAYHIDCDMKVIMEMNDPIKGAIQSEPTGVESISQSNGSQNPTTLETEISACKQPAFPDSFLSNKSHFWARFFWLSGRLSIFFDEKEKAYKEFCFSLSLLRNGKNENDPPLFIPLPHCKLIKGLSVDRVLHEIHLLKVDTLLKKTTGEMIDKGMYSECVNLLAPLLLSTKEIYFDLPTGAYKEGEGFTSAELLALDVLISACEKAKPMEIEVFLNCHRRKLLILTVAAGMMEPTFSQKALHKMSILKTNGSSEIESLENIGKQWNHLIAQEVKEISRSASLVKNLIDQNISSDGLSIPVSIIGDIQSLILTVMCNVVGTLLCQKSSGLGTGNQTEHLESQCLVDAAIAFCKLQRLIPAIPIKTQVELIVAIHELLAEYGLCCAGKDSEGEEGTFLKLAIKHLLALDMKLKSGFQSSNRGIETKQSNNLHCFDYDAKTSLSTSKLSTDVEVESVRVAKEDIIVLHKDSPKETTSEGLFAHEAPEKHEELVEGDQDGSDGKLHHLDMQNVSSEVDECGNHHTDVDREKVELGIDNALDQSFFCLYGLNLKCGPDSSDDDLAIHKNTSRGDYQTKEQCADVFQYILPYAKASSRAGLVKLRRVLRAIRRHFPQPPEEMLNENPIDKFLDSFDLCEDKLYEAAVSDGSQETIFSIAFPDGRVFKVCKTLSTGSSGPYVEVYGNLYYLISQAEETSATDKWPGFVLTKEGEEFVEQNANLFKYDLLYNPLRFESWQRLANIYDEEVDLLLNDGSKHKNVVEWRKHTTLPQRVQISRRRSRRCLLMSLALAKTTIQKSEIHELLALVYYDSLQNVVPIYDQRSVIPTKDAAWKLLCQNSMKHFEKAFQYKPEWSYAFYLGKLCEKLGFSCEKTFSYYSKSITLNPSAVDPLYRMHASRLKLLLKSEKQALNTLQVIATYSFTESTKETVLNMLSQTSQDHLELPLDVQNGNGQEGSENVRKHSEIHQLEDAWRMLYSDCLSALQVCVEGELKHFHKARYRLAQGLHKRGDRGDLEKAKDELSFCFKSSRSTFTINMWEIDGTVRKGRRKTPGLGGNKKALEVSLPESSRKFITCIRKYTLLYLNLLEKTGDLSTLERAYMTLRTDKRFSLCLEDITPVALGRYIQALTSSIQRAETLGSDVGSTVEHLLEKMFNVFIDHMNLWMDISNLHELKSPELTESSLYGYIHKYIQSLERDVRLDTIEAINEKIRKRFKNPKLSNSNYAKICKHASVAWCRSIVISLASITPLQAENSNPHVLSAVVGGSEIGPLLYVDLQAKELLSSFEDPTHSEALEMKWGQVVTRMRSIHIKQSSEENMDAASTLLRCAYNFYRESSFGTLPSGINLFTTPSRLTEGSYPPSMEGIEIIDLSIPRKLLLWAYTLVHGRYSNILAVVKHCEENAKPRMKKGTSTPSAATSTLPQTTISVPTHTAMITDGGGKEKPGIDESGEAEENLSTAAASTSLHEGSSVEGSSMLFSTGCQLLHAIAACRFLGMVVHGAYVMYIKESAGCFIFIKEIFGKL
ncbi:hypothetical protein MRB53_012128 [Persea americana]|uniref:Uncharacterized protein n=1 Tax=Persea americana TaxID=3435 RepID=A0ACC2LWW6_PERAE|nr:hypothetical protein MRB53_012128 [Persea americana]